MAFVRSIGKLGLTALIVNTIIGSGIFGVPSELIRLVGRASPLAMIGAGLGMLVIMACVVEVGSQFSEQGGAYLYARTAFGRFAGVEIGWFSWLAPLAAAAANANLFVVYLARFFPSAGSGVARALVLALVMGFPTFANYIGVESGARLSTAFSAAKLIPLLVLILLGLWRFGSHAELISAREIVTPGAFAWGQALLLLVFAYGGYENALLPTGELKDPRRTVPFSFFTALFTCIGVYTLIQFVTVATLGTAVTQRPLAAAANVLFGSGGEIFVSVAAMISTYGYISASALATPRLTYSLAECGDFPRVFAAIERRYKTPHISIVAFGLLAWLGAVTGSFRWALAVASGAILILYASMCAALLRFRKTRPTADAYRAPFGKTLAIIGMVVTLALLASLSKHEALVLAMTAVVAGAHWVVVKNRGE